MSPKDRRPLVDGLTPEPEVDPKAAREFVFQNKAKLPGAASEPKQVAPTRLAADMINPAAQSALIPLTGSCPICEVGVPKAHRLG